MKMFKPYLSWLLLAAVGTLAGCATAPTQAVAVSDSIRASLDQAGLKDVLVSQDRDKGVVTLSGNVAADDDKLRAAAIASSIAGAQIVANQIAVLTPGAEGDDKKVNVALDQGIENNLDAALITAKLHENVKYRVKNHVVTLTGEVDSQVKRARAEEIAAAVLNVEQVVNELQVKNQKVTSSQ